MAKDKYDFANILAGKFLGMTYDLDAKTAYEIRSMAGLSKTHVARMLKAAIATGTIETVWKYATATDGKRFHVVAYRPVQVPQEGGKK